MTKHYSIQIKNEKALVPFGTNLSSTIGYPRFKPFERKAIYIPHDLYQVFIGIIVSDASIQRQYKGDARLQFKQGYNNFHYFLLIPPDFDI